MKRNLETHVTRFHPSLPKSSEVDAVIAGRIKKRGGKLIEGREIWTTIPKKVELLPSPKPEERIPEDLVFNTYFSCTHIQDRGNYLYLFVREKYQEQVKPKDEEKDALAKFVTKVFFEELDPQIAKDRDFPDPLRVPFSKENYYMTPYEIINTKEEQDN